MIDDEGQDFNNIPVVVQEWYLQEAMTLILTKLQRHDFDLGLKFWDAFNLNRTYRTAGHTRDAEPKLRASMIQLDDHIRNSTWCVGDFNVRTLRAIANVCTKPTTIGAISRIPLCVPLVKTPAIAELRRQLMALKRDVLSKYISQGDHS